jgi:hypothetical protein
MIASASRLIIAVTTNQETRHDGPARQHRPHVTQRQLAARCREFAARERQRAAEEGGPLEELHLQAAVIHDIDADAHEHAAGLMEQAAITSCEG